MKGNELLYLPEPSLLFKYGQPAQDPRDGLTLFGPLDEGRPYGIRFGVIGTHAGILRLKRWLGQIAGPVAKAQADPARPGFPGFEAAFGVPWAAKPSIEIEVDPGELNRRLHLGDAHQRVFQTVELFSSKIIRAIQQDDAAADFWCVVIPDDVKKYCRPLSTVEPSMRVRADVRMKSSEACKLLKQPALFTEWNEAAEAYQYKVNFHNQIKARLLPFRAPSQIIQESTIAPWDFVDKRGKVPRDLDEQESDVAWHLATAAFYKAGGRPWKISGAREGVCYIGLVFKQQAEQGAAAKNACCAAQMFLDSGDGVVFKGAVGPWYNEVRGEFHLDRRAGRELVEMAVQAYAEKNDGKIPSEVFLHGRVAFNDEEWAGFKEGAGSSTRVVGVRIRPSMQLKLFRWEDLPVPRGVAYIADGRTAYLWSKGFVPRLMTYPGKEVPNPLLVEVSRGEADIKVVLGDIQALTKLNYNACRFADGEPVTLKFAMAVGEILTAGPLTAPPPLPFRLYI